MLGDVDEIEEGRPIWKLRPTMFALTLVFLLVSAFGFDLTQEGRLNQIPSL